MNDIIERELRELENRRGRWGVRRLRAMLIADDNTWKISNELGLSKCCIGFLRNNLAPLLQVLEPMIQQQERREKRQQERESKLTLVYHKSA
jgi:hypothetical protein